MNANYLSRYVADTNAITLLEICSFQLKVEVIYLYFVKYYQHGQI
jgi:hypothetical protein